MEITVTISERHAAAIRRCDFDGHQAPENVTDLKARVEWLLKSVCNQALLDESYSRLMLYKRRMRRQQGKA